MKLENEELHFVCELVELKQKHVEAFADAMQALGQNVNTVKYAGEICRATIRGGWIASPILKDSDVGEMDPHLVKWLANKLSDIYAEAVTVRTSLLEQVARFAQEPKKYDPPKELVYAWRNELYGLPEAGGWMEAQAGLIDRMTTAKNVYEAFTGYQLASSIDKSGEWIEANPKLYEVVVRVTELMNK